MIKISFPFLLLLLSILVLEGGGANAGGTSCNLFQGSWVFDSSYPLYNSTACPFIQHEFNCLKNGRPDHLYLNFRWEPRDCKLARYAHIYIAGKEKNHYFPAFQNSNNWLIAGFLGRIRYGIFLFFKIFFFFFLWCDESEI